MNLCQYFPTSRRTPFHNFVCKRGRFFISIFRFFFTLFKILQKHIQCHNTFLYLPSLQILHSEFEFRKQKEVICVMQSFYNKKNKECPKLCFSLYFWPKQAYGSDLGQMPKEWTKNKKKLSDQLIY